MWDEGSIRRLAAPAHGVLDRATLHGAGASDHEIQRKLRHGRLSLVQAGVYYLNATPATWKTDVMAGVMAAGPDAVASHRCAAVLYELDAIYGRLVEITVPYIESPEPLGVILHRTRRRNPIEIVDGIPTTSVDKALLDLAGLVPRRTLYKATLSAVRKRLTSPEKLDLAVGYLGGRGVRGTRMFRTVIRTVADDVSGSVAEVDLEDIVSESPVPRPIKQMKVRLVSGANAYPDFAWPDRMKLVEVDSMLAHSTPRQLQSDLTRQNALMNLGWEIRRFTARQIREEPDVVREEIVRFLNGSVL